MTSLQDERSSSASRLQGAKGSWRFSHSNAKSEGRAEAARTWKMYVLTVEEARTWVGRDIAIPDSDVVAGDIV